MSDIKNPLSAESYTNKDFQTIYVELLDAAKNLAKNWDPTISNESDPGVVLLKLNAIIADKNNYNIDKNVLENYPDTYTQEISARSQYKQLGYKMPWYKAATTTMSFKWVGDMFNDGDQVTIPKHTMVMDAQGEYVFTILEDAIMGKIPHRAATTTQVPAIQGTINTLKLSGSTVINLSNLDSKNRLFINDKNIAENGIYVTSADDPNGVLWTQVNNVEVQPFGTKCYEFDVDPKRNVPYIQFPEDVRNLIKTGIVVKYIVTSGYAGNVAAKAIDTFYDQSSVELIHHTGDKTNIPLTNESFMLYNVEGTINGQDPEDIESAARSFKRKVCTFDTLITLRDYMNAIYSFGKSENALSNVIVTDRTNDIQSHYRIVDKDDGLLGYVDHLSYTPVKKLIDVTKVDNVDFEQETILSYDQEYGYKIESDISTDSPIEAGTLFVERSENIDEMTAFDLKFYILKNGGLLNTLEAYTNTFTIDNSETTKTAVLTHLDSLRAIQHDVVDIKEYTPFMLQNLYPINLKLVPTFKLNDVAKNEVINNIKSTLINLLNSRNCDVGAEPSYDIIYNAISSCDERIKVLILDDFKYTTFAVYLGYSDNDVTGDSEFKFIPISDYSTCSRLIVKDGTNCNCSNTEVNNSVDAIKSKLQEAADKILGYNRASSTKALQPTDKQISSYRFIDSVNGIMYKWPKRVYGSSKTFNDPTLLEIYSSRLLDIRSEVIARNILAGVTPLFDVPTSSFNTALNMNQVSDLTAAVSNVSTNLEIAPFGFDASYSTNEQRSATYKLRANESLRFLAPSFISDRTYANYVKYELVLKNPVLSNSEFTWADPADEDAIFKTYGNTHFYTQTADNVYTPLYGSRYENLTDVPTFKLLYLHGIQRGFSQLSKELITNGNHFASSSKTLDSIMNNLSTYIPEYEGHVYYKLEDGVFKVRENYYPEFNNDLINGRLYRLKHYAYGLTNVDTTTATYKSDSYYVYDDELNLIPIKQLATNVEEQFIYDCLGHYTMYKSISYRAKGTTGVLTSFPDEGYSRDKETALETEVYIDTDKWDYYLPIPTSSSQDSIEYLTVYALANPNRMEEIGGSLLFKLSPEELSIIKFVVVNSLLYPIPVYQYANLTDECNCNEYDVLFSETERNPRFEQVKKYSSNVYLKVFKNGTLVGYKLLESNSEKELKDKEAIKGLILATYEQVCKDAGENVTAITDLDTYIAQGNIVVAVKPATWVKNYNTVYFVKYLEYKNGESIIGYTSPTAPPDYMLTTCLQQDKAPGTGLISYSKITETSSLAENWDNDYRRAFKQENYNGLHTSSPEYIKWKNGSLSLFVRKASYKLDANTEYQLREGDYIIFFWRGTDEDDAPYTYRKYTDIYDAETGQKTIIKPSFPIDASTYGTRLFNHDALNPSGQIPYSADNNSQFQIIFQKMYDEYDLSGSRQIEIRKMNSVKLDISDKKYYYFICPEVEVEHSTETNSSKEIFSFALDYSKEWEDKNGIKQYRFQHILQPDEYFIYMNADQTLYEVLGEGTLIEYNTSNPEGAIGLGARKIFKVTAIDSNEILYRGIDAFREYCRTVSSDEVFNLIEQQIYSFVKDDVVQISLKDNIGYSYKKVAERDNATHYLNYSFDVVSTYLDGNVESVEPFVDGEYYTLPDNIGEDHITFEDYVKVTEKPDGWDELTNWSLTSGIYYKKFYKLLFADYMDVDTASDSDIDLSDNNWYLRVDPKYPIFSTNVPLLVKDFNVSYSSANSNNEDTNQLDLTYTTLPNIDVDDDSYGWSVTAHLNMLCDNKKPQKIEIGSDNDQARQAINISGNRFPDKFFFEFTPEEQLTIQNNYPQLVFNNSQPFAYENNVWKPLIVGEDELYILSSIPLDKVGSTYMDVTYVDLLGERHDTEVFAYNLNASCINADNGWQVVDEGITLRVPAGSSMSAEITGITLDPNYKYLLPFSVRNDKVQVNITSNGETVKCICCDSASFGGVNHCGKHFIEIHPGMDNLTINATNSDQTNDIHIMFELLFKYSYRSIFGGNVKDGELEYTPKYQVTTEMLLNKIREIDVPGKFKYTHIPSIDVEIKDPLDPISMFNENHVYNQFTIARAELDSAKPYDASYDVVNNR